MKINVEFKILDERIREYKLEPATIGSAGIDLRACINETLTLQPGESVLVPTGLSIFVNDPNWMVFLLPRSGLGHKNGIILGNGTGVIDSDYQGPLMMSLLNRKNEPFIINPMDRVAQMILLPVAQMNLIEVKEFKTSERGDGGFNSTGKN